MYKKTIKPGRKSYVYYYHNFRTEGKITNICLGKDFDRAKALLSKILKERGKRKSFSVVVKKCRRVRNQGEMRES